MAHQLIFTSLEKTLLGGSGYGIAAQTPHLPRVLAEELSKLAGYVEIYPARDANRQWNPFNYFFWKVSQWYVLGRLSSAENDYSGRFNFLGEFFCLESSELPEAGPAALLQALPFHESFQGPARMLGPCNLPTIQPPASLVCKQWADASGDAGWGGAFAKKLKNEPTVWVLYDRTLHGEKSLALVAEAMALLDPADRWSTTFSTHVEGFPKGNQVHLRMLQQGADQTRDFKAHLDCFDLTKTNWPQPGRSSWVEMARTGIRPAHWKSPASPSDLGSHDAPHSEPLGSRPHGHTEQGGFASAGDQGHLLPHASAPKAVPPSYHPPIAAKDGKGKSSVRLPRLVETPQPTSISGTPWWLYLAAAIGVFLAFGLGLATGIQISRSGLEESTALGKDQKWQIEEQEKSILDLTEKNAALTMQKEGLEKAVAIANEEKANFKKYRDFLIGNGPNQAKLVGKVSDKDDENLKSALESLNSLNENSRLYVINKDRISRLAGLEKSFKLYLELETAKKNIIDDPIIDETLRAGLSFDERFKGLIADKIKQKNELANKESFLKNNLKELNDIIDKKEYKLSGTKEDLFGKEQLELLNPMLFTEKTAEFSIAGKDNDNYFKEKIIPETNDQSINNEKSALAKLLLSMGNTAATSSIILVDNKISYPIVRFLTNQGADIKKFGDKSFNKAEDIAIFEKLKIVIDELIKFKNKK